MKIVEIRNLLLLLLLGFAACKKDEITGNADDIPGLGGDEWVKGPIDDWIYANYTQPYNVDVKYKWTQTELGDISKFVTPPDEGQVIPVMSSIKSVWIGPYEAEAGPDFMRKYMPRFVILFGSASYNSDGTVLLGQAEGEGRILLFDVNNFRTKNMPGYIASDSNIVKRMFETIEHEFAHTLHFNIMYPVAFKTITGGYTSNWNNVSNGDAHEAGFITAYAMSKPDDDFAETVCYLLVNGDGWWKEMLASISSEQGRNALLQKEAMVVDYFRNAWGIDFYSLQSRTRTAITSIIK